MTSRIIVAIVAVFAVVLSLAAPVAVDAQSRSMSATLVSIGEVTVAYSGFTAGETFYVGYCSHTSTHPASCSFDSNGRSQAAGTVGICHGDSSDSAEFSSFNRVLYQRPSVWISQNRYTREAAYSDAACTTELAAVTYTYPMLPTWRARDITESSATIYIETPFAQHRIREWDYIPLTPSVPRLLGNCARVGDITSDASASPAPVVTGLSAGTTYTYKIIDSSYLPCPQESGELAEVTFTTLPSDGSAPPGPPPPDPPSGVDGGEPTTAVDGGSVTLSWSNPGDSSIASYEYQIRQAGGAAGEWRTVPGSNADTTSVTIDLATGVAVAVNNATPPMVEWTIHLRARDVNGNAGGIFTTTVNTAAGETVPAVPLAGLAMLALFLFMSGQRKRKGG